MTAIDAKECRQLRYNISDNELQSTFHSTPPIDEERNPVSIENNISSYNLKNNIIYILMPLRGDFIIVKSKKKKHLNEFTGKLPKKHTDLKGVHGWFLDEKVILIYYDNTAIYQWKVPNECKFKVAYKEPVKLPKPLVKRKAERRIRQTNKKRKVRTNFIAIEQPIEEYLDEEDQEFKEQIENTIREGLESTLINMEINLKSTFQLQSQFNAIEPGPDYVSFSFT